MANPVAVPLSVDPEIVALGNVLKGLIADIKAKKTVLQDATDAYVAAAPALASIGDSVTDIKRNDNQVYLLKCLVDSFENVPAAV